MTTSPLLVSLLLCITVCFAQGDKELSFKPRLDNGFLLVEWNVLAYKIEDYWVAVYYGEATNTSTIFEDGILKSPNIGPLAFSGSVQGSHAWYGDEYQDKDAIIVFGTDFEAGLESVAFAALKSGDKLTYSPLQLSNMKITTGAFIVDYKAMAGLNPKANNHQLALYEGRVPSEPNLKATVAVSGTNAEGATVIIFSALRSTDYTLAWKTGTRAQDVVAYVTKRS